MAGTLQAAGGLFPGRLLFESLLDLIEVVTVGDGEFGHIDPFIIRKRPGADVEQLRPAPFEAGRRRWLRRPSPVRFRSRPRQKYRPGWWPGCAGWPRWCPRRSGPGSLPAR